MVFENIFEERESVFILGIYDLPLSRVARTPMGTFLAMFAFSIGPGSDNDMIQYSIDVCYFTTDAHGHVLQVSFTLSSSQSLHPICQYLASVASPATNYTP